jgi:hypothetical protein
VLAQPAAQPGLGQRQHHRATHRIRQQQYPFPRLGVADHVVEAVQQEQPQLLAPGRTGGAPADVTDSASGVAVHACLSLPNCTTDRFSARSTCLS